MIQSRIVSFFLSFLSFTTITLPRSIIEILQWSGFISVQINFQKLLILFILLAFISSWTYKLKVLNKYSTLPKTLQLNKKAHSKHLHPELNYSIPPDSAHDGFHNYLDEFLSAIRVFGFLEKPVFHELARHLQTRRLIAGDTLNLDEDKSFYIVIDGSVQVFARPTPNDPRDPNPHFKFKNHTLAYDHEDDNGFQLLNVVGPGGTLSSLFTILALFTEDVKLRYEDQDDLPAPSQSPDSNCPSYHLPTDPPEPDLDRQRDDDDVIDNDNDDVISVKTSGRSLSTSKPHPHKPTSRAHSPYLSTSPDQDPPSRPAVQPRESTLARAITDTTLAVIPSSAFKRLTSKFPNAVAHILQVILTRLQRVTFLTSHQYLGLTKELLRTEKAFNELACYPLPDSFYEQGGMVRLRQRFLPQTSKLVDEPVRGGEHSEYFNLDPARATFNPVLSARQKALNNVALKLRPPASPQKHQKPSTISVDLGSPTTSSVADLHSDLELRKTVMTCIAKSIGLVQHATRPPPATRPSPEPSVRRPSFRSGLGSLTYLKTLDGASSANEYPSSTSSVAMEASSATGGDHDQEELPNEVEILFFPRDSMLVKAGERNSGLYFVIDGFLDVFMPLDEDSEERKKQTEMKEDGDRSKARKKEQDRKPYNQTKEKRDSKRRPLSTAAHALFDHDSKSQLDSHLTTTSNEQGPIKLFSIKPGGIAGYLASISGFPSYVDIKAKTDVYVGFLPARALESIMDRRPIVLLTLAKRLISLLSPLMLHIDSALEWMAVDAGQIIYREGDASDNLYVVIGGRLRCVNEKSDTIVGEYGQGESIGELDCITNTTRRSTLHAIRDSELVRIPMTLFNAISIRHPAITIQVSRLIASRVRKELDASKSSSLKTEHPKNFNLKTVAIVPNTGGVPIVGFANALRHALDQLNAITQVLDQAVILSVLGRHAFSRLGKLKLTGWLAELEREYRIVLYVADTGVGAPWTQTCIRQADYILVVCDGGSEPELGEYERLLVGMKTTARKELVLLHPDRNVPAGSTRPWLKNRPWIHAHHHVELAGTTPLAGNHLDELLPVTALRHLKERVRIQISKYRRHHLPSEPRHAPGKSDFARLARRLCGKSIAVVLGGGGARGISHIGVLRALIENEIPIDMIGGTSIGSFIGGLFARNSDLLGTIGRAKTFSGRMGSLWRVLTDITYPVVAYTTGHEFNRGIYKCFYDYHIEDFWLPFWANTTNITWSRMEVHTTGYAWRYIRASMSLAGLLPPLCDEGDMLVDGGYIDNLPVSVMLRMGADSVFAVDVGSIDDTSPRNFPESVSGWWLLLSRLNPWSSADSIPSMTDIQSRLTYVSSVKTLEEAKATSGVLYMRMPVTQYTTMDFGKFEEIYAKGYEAAKEMITNWSNEYPCRLPDGIERRGTAAGGGGCRFWGDEDDGGANTTNSSNGGGGGKGRWRGSASDRRRRLMVRRNSI